MLKLNSLRTALEAAMPELAVDPNRLTLRIEKGRIASTGVPQPVAPATDTVAGFEYRYTLAVVLLDFAGNPDLVFATTLVWLVTNQPEILDRYYAGAQDGGISFDVDHLDENKIDLEVRLDLVEAVDVTAAGDAAWTFTHRAEPKGADQLTQEALGLVWAGV